MGAIAFPILGAAGAYAGVSAGVFAASYLGMSTIGIGWTLGSVAGSLLQGAPDLPPVVGPQLADTKITSSAYGEMLPWVFGRAPVGGNIINASNWTNIPTTTVVETGGKGGGGSEQVQTTFHQEATLAVVVCDCRRQGPITGIRRIKSNGKVIRDVGSTASPAAVLGSDQSIRIYTGTSTQLPDSLIEALVGVGRTPAYRYSAYVVFDSLNRDNFGRFEFEVVRSGSTTTMQPVEMFDLPSSEIIYDRTDGLPDSSPERTPIPGADQMWIVIDVAGNPRKIALVNNYTGVYSASNTGTGNISIMGVGFNGRVIYQEYGVGIKFMEQNGRVRRMAIPTFHANDGTNRLWQVYEDTSDDDRGDAVSLYIHYNSNVPSVHAIKYCEDYSLITDDDTATESQLTFGGNTLPKFAWNAAGIADRLYTTASAGTDSNRSRISYITPGTITVTDVVVFNSLAVGEQIFCLVGNDGFLYAIGDTTTALEKYTADGTLVDSVMVPTATSATLMAQDGDGNLYYQVGTALRRINTGTMEIELTSTIASNYSIVAGVNVFMALGVLTTRVPTGADQGTIFEIDGIPRIANTTADLGTDIVETICLECGYEASDIDVTDITGIPIDGYTITNRGPGRASIEPLMGIKFFGAVESDDAIKFVRHNNSSIVTIPSTELAAHVPGEETPDEIAIVRQNELEIPAEFTFTYFSRDNDYVITPQTATNSATSSQKKMSLAASIVMSDDAARHAVETVRDAAWTEREAYRISTTRRYAKYEPLDVVTLQNNGRDNVARITRRIHGGNGVMKWEALPQATEILTQYASGAIPKVNIPALMPIGPTELAMLDTHLLRDADDNAGHYMGARGLAAGWDGTSVHQSKNSGVSYSALTNGIILTACGIGRALTALADTGTTDVSIYDENSTVSVYLPGYTLTSYTRAQVAEGLATPVLVGDEIIYYRDATLTATDTYTLSGLLRARKGTESNMSTHAVGDRVAVLDANLRSIIGVMSDAGKTYLYKPVSVGATLSLTSPFSFTNTARRKKPLAPKLLKAGLYSVSGDILIQWTRRTRLDNPWRDGADAPLGETDERYLLEILDGATVVRSKIVTEPEYLYLEADQVTDWTETQTTLSINVYQISSEYGAGYVANATVSMIRDIYWDNVVALLHFAGADGATTFTDQKGHTFTASGNAQIDTAVKKFGSGSLLVDGTGDLISSVSHADWVFGSGDFTVEFQFRANSLAGTGELCGRRAGANYGPFVIYHNGTTLEIYLTSANGSWDIANGVGFGTITTSVQYHIALNRTGSAFRAYLEGVGTDIATSSATLYDNGADLEFMGHAFGGDVSNGWGDELRITKGVGRYPADFTPPTEQFPRA